MRDDGAWDGEDYQRRLSEKAATTSNPHGEADLVMRYTPSTVLDAGCGTGRVALELARRGVGVVGVDADASMLDVARRLAAEDPRTAGIGWLHSPLQVLDLGRTFDVVVLAGNVPLFTPAGTTAALVAGCARHVGAGGVVVAGFALDRDYGVEQYDREAADADLVLAQRWSTWDRDPFTAGADYAVSVHRRP